MSKKRSADSIKESIRHLAGEAEHVAHAERKYIAESFGKTPQASASHNLSEKQIRHYLQGLDIAISEEAVMALRAEFMRFSSIFDTDKTRDTIRAAIGEVTTPLVQAWIEKNMPTIARDVVREAIGRIAETGRNR